MVVFAGDRPVFADVELETCNISTSEVERLISSKTGAVLITHLHGLAAETRNIHAVCKQTGVPLIEYAAQAFGSLEQVSTSLFQVQL